MRAPLVARSPVAEAVGNSQKELKLISNQLEVSPTRITAHKLVRRSIDARKKPPKFVLRFQVWVDEEPENWEQEIRRCSGRWHLVIDDRDAAPAAQLELATAVLDNFKAQQDDRGLGGTVN